MTMTDEKMGRDWFSGACYGIKLADVYFIG
jgi:hypothetical protein